MIKTLFRVDAGPQIGLGHLQRCLSLATALRQQDAVCLFLNREEPDVQDRIIRFGFNSHGLGGVRSWGTDDVARTVAIAASQGCAAIVVDSDCKGAEYLSELRRAGFYVLAIDDIAPHPFPCQMVVNGDVHACQLPYRSTSGDTLFLLGPEYSILRPEFCNAPSRASCEDVDNILVTLGGADPFNLMPRVLKAIDDLVGTFSIVAVVGPFFDNLAQVEIVAKGSQHRVSVVRSLDSTYDLMLGADLAVSSGGQTLYELACVGCPTVAVRISSNQAGQLAVFDEAGILRLVGQADDIDVITAIRDAVGSLLPDPAARARMASAGQRLIDGQGAVRVAERTIAEVCRWQGGRD